MTLNLKSISLRSLFFKIIAYAVGFYLLLVVASLLVTGYIFFNLNGYKYRIEQTIYKHTGYKLLIGSIETKLSNAYLPELQLKDIKLTNPINRQQNLNISRVDLVLSYSSIWNLEPIFHKIEINGSKIAVVNAADGSIIVNGINVNNPDRQTLENTKNSPIDLERWLLRQHEIVLSGIDLSYLDIKNGLPQIDLRNLGIGLERSLWNKHRLYVDLSSKNYQDVLEATLEWQGGKFSTWKEWEKAELKVNTINGPNNLIHSLQGYLPGSPFKDFNAITAVDATMKKGKLERLYANFDVNNFRLALADADLVNFPKLGGKINIQLRNERDYDVKADHLVFITNSGSLFNNASIDGHYTIGKQGSVELSNTNLIALNNLLSLFDATNGLKLEGLVNSVKFTWLGYLTHPTTFTLNSSFNDVTLTSSRPEYPSLSHVSGDISIGHDEGKLNLTLKGSVLNYNKLFLIPYEFKSLQSKIEWQLDKQKHLKVTLNKTPLETKDFKGWVSGVYTNNPDNPNSPSYLTMYAHVDRVLAHKVGDYLPKSISMGVHEWLNMGLAGGYGTDANMVLRGPLADFPFENGKGLFYITANLENAKLQYVKDWPPLENISGKFILKNTNITIKADSATLVGNQLDPTVVVIPDYASESGVYLVADGQAHGTTDNFMKYLKQTPVSKIIGDLPDKLASLGDGNLKIHLMVPFKDPHHTEVQGVYHFNDNSIQFDMPIPLLSSVNGDLGFSQHGVEISDLKAHALNSQANLSATTGTDGIMRFKIDTPDLDYQALAAFYLQPFSQLISGRSPSLISFDVGKGGIKNLTASSNLTGVELNLPKPLKKLPQESSAMSLTMQPTANKDGVVINWSLGALLRGQQAISEKNAMSHGQVAIGLNSKYLIDANANSQMTVNVDLTEVNISDWLSTVNKLVQTVKAKKESEDDSVTLGVTTDSQKLAETFKAKAKAHYQVFPMQIAVTADSFGFGKTDLKSGSANIIVEDKQSYFNLYTPVASGFGNFDYASKKVNVNLDKFMFHKKTHINETKSSAQVVFKIPDSLKDTPNIPDINLQIRQLFFQNHSLGKVSAQLHQQGRDLSIESGTLLSPDARLDFNAVNYCFSCEPESAYVDFHGHGEISDAGNLAVALDLGRIINKGRGSVNARLQWNGGFQNFDISQVVGSINANLQAGKFLKVNPGVLGGLMSIINLQGIFELGSGDVQGIFKQGFFFNHLDIDTDILATQIELKKVHISGPLADVNSFGQVNFGNNSVNAYVAVTPKLGVAVALTAGVVTLDPVVGLAVYLGELVFDDPQNKLFTLGYHVTGNLKKPKVESVKVSEQLSKNANSLVD